MENILHSISVVFLVQPRRHDHRHHPHPNVYYRHHYACVASLAQASSKLNLLFPNGLACGGTVTRVGGTPIGARRRGGNLTRGGPTPIGIGARRGNRARDGTTQIRTGGRSVPKSLTRPLVS